MQLRVVREFYRADFTIGRMLVDGQFECYTLEDGIRTNKVAGETAIPAGSYPVTITYSNAFRRELPLVSGVRNFTGIRIHSGNSNADTLGCILVGQSWSPGASVIGSSQRALQALLPKIQTALAAGDSVMLSVEQPGAPPELASRELIPISGRRGRKAKKSTGRATAAKTAKTAKAAKTAKTAKTASKKAAARAGASRRSASKSAAARPKAPARKVARSGARKANAKRSRS